MRCTVVATLMLLLPLGCAAIPTDITVRVLARDAKFIGDSMGGMRIILRDFKTGEVLAEGLTTGGTGSTKRIIQQPWLRGVAIATPKSAAFNATLDLAAPTYLQVTAEGPIGHPQAETVISARQWVIPGRHLTGGNGWMLEAPGFVVGVVDTPRAITLDGNATIPVAAEVQMMCGCPITPGGLWDANRLEVKALVTTPDGSSVEVPLAYAGTPNRFSSQLVLDQVGVYDLQVFAYDPANGNTGLHAVSVRTRRND